MKTKGITSQITALTLLALSMTACVTTHECPCQGTASLQAATKADRSAALHEERNENLHEPMSAHRIDRLVERGGRVR